MKKIESLTEEQKARFPEFVEKWTKIGLSTQPANRALVEEGIKLAYKTAGEKPPLIVWCGSPMGNAVTRAIVQKLSEDQKKEIAGDSVGDSVWASVRDSVRDSVWDSVGDSVWDSVRDSVWASVGASVRDSVGDSVRDSVRDSVWASVGASVRDSVGASVRDSVRDSVWASVGDSVGDSVGASVRDSVRDSVWASVWASVRDSVGASVWASVWDSVGDSVGASVRDSVRDSVWASVRASVWDSVGDSVGASVRDSVGDSGYGQHDANWIGFYDFFEAVLGLRKQTEKLDGLRAVTENAGWYLPHENICWVSERHNRVKTDDRGRLHCEDGPALQYPDGWGLFYWHGTKVPEEWILDRKSLTAVDALKCANLEQRRCACEILGWNNILKELDARTIDKDTDPQIGELLEVAIPDIGKEKFLRVQCGTMREFAMPVPPEMQTALQANAWTYAIDDWKAYKPEIRT